MTSEHQQPLRSQFKTRFQALAWSAGIFGGLAATMAIAAVVAKPYLDESKCWHQLRSIGCTIAMYQNQARGAYPATWRELAETQQITTTIFVCPASRDASEQDKTFNEQLADLAAAGTHNSSYIYTGSGLAPAKPMTGQDVLACEAMANHGNGIHVLLSDDTVIWLSQSKDAVKIDHLNADIQAGVRPLRLR